MPSQDQLLEESGLVRLKGAIREAFRNSVRLTATARGEDAVTRLGGRPNLSPKFEWPDWEGEPLGFVAQIDLATLPRTVGVRLPHKGGLYFFYEGGRESWGFRPKDKDSCRVLYSSDPLGKFPPLSLPDDLDEERYFKTVHLSVGSSEISIPNIQDAAIAKMALTLEERKAYVDFYRHWNEANPKTIHRIGGYPDCIQGDPKVRAQLSSHGIDCGSSSGYEEGKRRGLLQGAADWELLLQVDSEEKSEMMWRDRGRIYFLIRQEDLAERRFDRTRIVLQSR